MFGCWPTFSAAEGLFPGPRRRNAPREASGGFPGDVPRAGVPLWLISLFRLFVPPSRNMARNLGKPPQGHRLLDDRRQWKKLGQALLVRSAYRMGIGGEGLGLWVGMPICPTDFMVVRSSSVGCRRNLLDLKCLPGIDSWPILQFQQSCSVSAEKTEGLPVASRFKDAFMPSI